MKSVNGNEFYVLPCFSFNLCVDDDDEICARYIRYCEFCEICMYWMILNMIFEVGWCLGGAIFFSSLNLWAKC